MANSPTSDNSLLAKFKADYWAVPQSQFALAYSKALLSSDASTRDAQIEAVLKQYGYDTLTSSEIDSITNPNDMPPSPSPSPPASRPTTPTPQDPTSPPSTTPDTTGASNWIFLAFAGTYNVNSGGFPTSTIQAIVGKDGTLNLGSSQTPLQATVLMDAQDSPWVQWNVTPNLEWYIAEFSSNFDTTLNSTVRELTGFHCVVASGGAQTNTPIKAQCTSLRPHIQTKDQASQFFGSSDTWVGVAFTGLLLLGLNRFVRHMSQEAEKTKETQEKAQNIYQERLEVISDIARKGAHIAAEESLSMTNEPERKELHDKIKQSVKTVVDNYYANGAHDPPNVNDDAVALTQSCQKAAASALADWSSVIIDSNPSGLQAQVVDYMQDHKLMDAADLKKTSGYFKKAVGQKVLTAYKKATGAKGSATAGIDAMTMNYLKLELFKRQMGSLATRIQTGATNVTAAAKAVEEAQTDYDQKAQKAETSKEAWQKLVDQATQAANKDDAQLKEDLAEAQASYETAKDSAADAATALDKEKTAQTTLKETQETMENEQKESESSHATLEKETKSVEGNMEEHFIE
ncbi:hypothetical protein FMUND_6850 [Fusarium mundagurra]|uniref:Uncharacterized protein n=1 Tax=Fusarium mundagurra TaxID=1567541 RepID=A0A8H5YPS2_9HYPO|nr:hypothetical protein FMUND_6850 [Fusarium mundagurra]